MAEIYCTANLFSYSAIQPQVCNKLSVQWISEQNIL